MYYKETAWDDRNKKEIIRIFRKGIVKHVAVFYEEKLANQFLAFINS